MASTKLLKLAHEKLSPANLESGLPGRESQRNKLLHFLQERLKVKPTNKTIHINKTIFVCGVPGTGKTATVRLVLDQLEKEKSVDSADIVYINAQHLVKPEKLYCEILHKLSGENVNSEKAQEKLDKIFLVQSSNDNDNNDDDDHDRRKGRSRSAKKIKKVSDSYKIVVVDELDLLYNEKRQSVFYSLFDWPTQSNSRIILIAIANAMDLPERFMRGRISSRAGWEKTVFESYTSDCLATILEVRLGKDLLNKTFERSAVIIATKRIGRTSGDARRILDTCRLAIEMAISKGSPKVTPADIDQVGFQNVDLQRANFVRNCMPLQLMILKCIVLETDKVGEDRVETYGVYRQLVNMMSRYSLFKGFNLTPGDYQNHLRALAGTDIIFLEGDKPLLERRLYVKDSSSAFRELIRSEQIKTK